jgi:FKBP-type peptidyl-prolyl cis-trans isomerase
MRRAYALIAIPLLAALAVAGCSSSTPTKSSSAATANASVTATGDFGKTPKVTIPSEKAGSNLVTKTLIKGSGATVTSSDSFMGEYVAYIWDGTKHSLLTTTYNATPALFPSSLLTGLQAAVKNATVGSRVLAVMPPKDAFGSTGDSQLGITATDTLVYVIDVVKVISNDAAASGSHVSSGGGSLPTVTDAATDPTITIPKGVSAPKSLETKTLLQGTGATVAKNDYIVVQYNAVIWRTGKVFNSSWSSGPFGTVLNTDAIIPGWVDGLVGQKVGSRVMLVIPPKDGYGTSGYSEAGIKGTDDLVFVVDILASYTSTAS